MKAFLLTAGLGTRLRPLTDKTPKCLLPVNGKPLLHIWLDLLAGHGVDQVLINTHWHHEKVEGFVKKIVNGFTQRRKDAKVRRKDEHRTSNGKTREAGPGRSSRITNQQITNNFLEVRLFYEPELLGSGGTLLANRDWVADGEPFFILYGDNLTNVDLGQMYDFHCRSPLPFSLGVFKTHEPERCGIAETDDSGVVVDFVEKPESPKSNLVGKMKAYFIEEFLMDIGTPESYEKAQIIWPQIKCLTAESQRTQR